MGTTTNTIRQRIFNGLQLTNLQSGQKRIKVEALRKALLEALEALQKALRKALRKALLIALLEICARQSLLQSLLQNAFNTKTLYKSLPRRQNRGLKSRAQRTPLKQ